MQSNRHARVCVRSVAEPRRPLLRDIYEAPTFVPEATGRLEKWKVAKLCQTKIGTPVRFTLDEKEMFHFQNRISLWRIKSEYLEPDWQPAAAAGWSYGASGGCLRHGYHLRVCTIQL